MQFGPATLWEERATVCLLEEADALDAIPEHERSPGARAATIAPLHIIPVGEWRAARDAIVAQRPAMGLYIIDGRLLCQVGIGDRWSAELLGSGDLIRPWDAHGHDQDVVPFEMRWQALTDVSAAVLDERFMQRVARFPDLMSRLLKATMERTQRLAWLLAVAQHPRLEVRLLALLWSYAERWGRVTPEGTVVHAEMTHEILGRAAGAQRPSVTLALGRLRAAGLVRKRSDGSWLLLEGPPTQVTDNGTTVLSVDVGR